MGKSVLSTISSIMEVAQPLSQGEQNFKALHGPLEPKKDLVPGVTDQDHIFNGTPRKEDPKTASYENFRDDDESKEAYDKTLKVDEEPEKDKDVKEEVEAVEEAIEEVTSVEEEVEAVDEAMKGEAEYNARYGAGGKKRPPLDPVGKEDSDVNNDGKVNSSDSYINNRRKVISKYLKKEDAEVVVPVKKVEVEEETAFVKTDWKAILTKKAVSEEVEEEIPQITESLKLLKTYKSGEHTAKVYKDTDWDEHRVKFFSGDTHHKDADYHTDDVDDAHETAKTQLKGMVKKAMQEQIDLELNEKKKMDVWSAVLARRYEKQALAAKKKGEDSSDLQKKSDEYKKKVYSESEELEEASKEGLRKYAKKAIKDARYETDDKAQKRLKGANLAYDKIEGKTKVAATEEVQLVDEKHLTVAEKKKREEIAQAIARKNPDMPMGKKMAIATAQAKKVAEEVEELDEAQFSRDQLNSAMAALEKTKKAASAEKDMSKRTNHLMRQNFLTKQISYMRSAISNEGTKQARMAEEIQAVAEAVDVDVNMHEFMAGKAKRAIDVLKKNNRPIPDELLRTYEKHKQEIAKYKKDISSQRNEAVDFATARSDRGAVKTYVKYGKDGKTELVSRRDPRKEIKIGEAINDVNMMQPSVDKLKSDPLVSKEKIKLPPSQGLKAIGGDEQVHAQMAEEKLNRLYESLSDKNKMKFVEMLETDSGIEKLIKFAESQGF